MAASFCALFFLSIKNEAKSSYTENLETMIQVLSLFTSQIKCLQGVKGGSTNIRGNVAATHGQPLTALGERRYHLFRWFVQMIKEVGLTKEVQR